MRTKIGLLFFFINLVTALNSFSKKEPDWYLMDSNGTKCNPVRISPEMFLKDMEAAGLKCEITESVNPDDFTIVLCADRGNVTAFQLISKTMEGCKRALAAAKNRKIFGKTPPKLLEDDYLTRCKDGLEKSKKINQSPEWVSEFCKNQFRESFKNHPLNGFFSNSPNTNSTK